MTTEYVLRVFGPKRNGGRHVEVEQRKGTIGELGDAVRVHLDANPDWEVRVDREIKREDGRLDSATLLGFYRVDSLGRIRCHQS